MIRDDIAQSLTAKKSEALQEYVPSTAIAVVAGLTGLAFVWGVLKASYVRSKLEASGKNPLLAAGDEGGISPNFSSGEFVDVLSHALQEEIEFRAGVNRVIGPAAGTLLFGLTHYNNRASLASNSVMIGDVMLGGILYESVYKAAYQLRTDGLAPSSSGLSAVKGLGLGLLASTVAHTAHNLGVRFALRKK